MKKVFRRLLFWGGIVLVILFFVTIAHDYYLAQTSIYAVPLGIQFTIGLSGILFLIPGCACMIISSILKKKEMK